VYDAVVYLCSQGYDFYNCKDQYGKTAYQYAQNEKNTCRRSRDIYNFLHSVKICNQCVKYIKNTSHICTQSHLADTIGEKCFERSLQYVFDMFITRDMLYQGACVLCRGHRLGRIIRLNEVNLERRALDFVRNLCKAVEHHGVSRETLNYVQKNNDHYSLIHHLSTYPLYKNSKNRVAKTALSLSSSGYYHIARAVIQYSSLFSHADIREIINDFIICFRFCDMYFYDNSLCLKDEPLPIKSGYGKYYTDNAHRVMLRRRYVLYTLLSKTSIDDNVIRMILSYMSYIPRVSDETL
jgi:hypothetical protein